MLGAIIGDVAGSLYETKEVLAHKQGKKVGYEERIKILNFNTPIFTKKCEYTDDSVLTVAIAKALLTNFDYEKWLRYYGNKESNLGKEKYGRSRFGGSFISWLKGQSAGVSLGNGASMRVSPVGFYFNSLEEVLSHATLATIPSHNHEDAIACAKAVAESIFLAKNKKSKIEIKSFVENDLHISLDFQLETLQKEYTFSSESMSSVPQAICCFLQSKDFESCLRISLSIGGDADTVACIACSIAEAFYGIPNQTKKEVEIFLPPYMKDVLREFYHKIN